MALAALMAAACATPPAEPRPDELTARAHGELAQRGLGTDILALVHNILGHEPGPPPGTLPLVSALLSQPLAAADADALFRQAVPRELQQLGSLPATRGMTSLDDLLAEYIGEVQVAQRLLREAAGAAAPDARAILELLANDFDPAEPLVSLAGTDTQRLAQANARFLRATLRLVDRLRGAAPALRFPERLRRFESPIGIVEIGTWANERHSADAALIIDPGGDDAYDRRPVTHGRVSVVIDLGGNDVYSGPDVAIDGFAALVDVAGNDRYDSEGPGLAAAVFGTSLLLDLSGDDRYHSTVFGQGAAGFGIGALIDYEGDDRYELQAAGQGFGLPGGLGLLWDKSGNDHYRAGGMQDAYARGGGVSFAQGAAFGLRSMLAGGIGIVRDDRGDDSYEAQMFAQGTGYVYGLGLAWDRSGKDRWHAVRYAQGNGVHQAVGVLRDEAGDDSYDLGFGVGQGMGLDLSVGMLYDAGGDDRYKATIHAQGSATANGIGVLFDAGGADEWQMAADPRGWGRTEPERGLPSLGLLLYDEGRAAFLRDGNLVAAPHGGAPIDAPVSSRARRCPAPTATAPQRRASSFASAVRSLEFVFRDGSGDPATRAYVEQRLRTDLQGALNELPEDEFVTGWVIGNLLPCVLRQAPADDALAMWTAMEQVLAADPGTRFASSIAAALRERPAPSPRLRRLIDALARHPSCGVRSRALDLDGSAAAAQAALHSSCWVLQAAALRLLQKLGVPPDGDAPLPSFLRAPTSAATSAR